MTWDDFQMAASRAYLDGIDLIACIDTLEAGNRPAVLDGIRSSDAGLTMHVLFLALMARTHLITVRAYQPARKGDMHMRAVIEAVDKGRVTIPAHISEADISLAVRLFHHAAAHPARNALEHIRHKELAHLADIDPAIGRPVIKELFEMARLTADVGEALGNAAQAFTMPLSNQTEAIKASAKRFWDKWT